MFYRLGMMSKVLYLSELGLQFEAQTLILTFHF